MSLVKQNYSYWFVRFPSEDCPIGNPWRNGCTVISESAEKASKSLANYVKTSSNILLTDDVDPEWPSKAEYIARYGKGLRLGDISEWVYPAQVRSQFDPATMGMGHVVTEGIV